MVAQREFDSEEFLIRRAVDQTGLLEGENPQTGEPDDVLHWIKVYSELLAFKLKMLADMTVTADGMTETAASEVREVDLELVDRQRRRYEQRLRFWEARAREIAGTKASPIKTGG